MIHPTGTGQAGHTAITSQITRLMRLSGGETIITICLVVFIQYQYVTDRQTVLQYQSISSTSFGRSITTVNKSRLSSNLQRKAYSVRWKGFVDQVE